MNLVHVLRRKTMFKHIFCTHTQPFLNAIFTINSLCRSKYLKTACMFHYFVSCFKVVNLGPNKFWVQEAKFICKNWKIWFLKSVGLYVTLLLTSSSFPGQSPGCPHTFHSNPSSLSIGRALQVSHEL